LISTVAVGQASLITFTAYSAGTQTDLGTVTVGIKDANGTEVVAPLTAVSDGADGTYTYTLAKQTQVRFLIVTWSVTGGADFITYLDVIGSELFDEATLRTFDDDAISSASYTDAQIAQAHYQAAQYIEEQTGRSYIRRYARAEIYGSGSRFQDLSGAQFRTSTGLQIPRPGAFRDINQVFTTDYSSATAEDGLLTLTDSVFPRSETPLVLEYEYGLGYPVGIASRVGMLLAKQWLVSSRIPSGADTFTDPLGSYGMNDSRLPFEAYNWLRQKSLAYF
jgi:hypothetical protein